ncbi:MAG: hypothetical protein WD049_09850 [Candidatus Paceibacterota bacterium]
MLKEQVAAFFEVTVRTVENYLEQNAEELGQNGYEVLIGKRLQALKLAIQWATKVPAQPAFARSGLRMVEVPVTR